MTPDRPTLLQHASPQARVYTLREACALLSTSENTVVKLLRTKKLRGYRIPDTPHGRWKISEQAIADYNAAREAAI